VYDPAQLSLDDYQIVFDAGGVFDIVNTTTGETISTGNTYTAGDSIFFAGIEISLSDNGIPPQAGDRFVISTTKDAARNIAVDPSMLHDPKKLAAASTLAAGDNTNALALAGLREIPLIDNETLGEFYHSLVSSIGLESQNNTMVAEQQQLLISQLETRRESIAGVSLDEEQIDLIRFQQAFTAAARFIRVAEELGETVLSLVQ
jgi:flagellar hook-associated protein 1 FlgK